jgi:hypothetical protein
MDVSDSLMWTSTHHNIADTAAIEDSNSRFDLTVYGTGRPAVLDNTMQTTVTATSLSMGGSSWCPTSLEPYVP